MKKVLRLRDTWVLIVSLASLAAAQLPIAIPTHFNMYLSNYIGIFSAIPLPVLSSLLLSFVTPDEVCAVNTQQSSLLY